MFLQPIMRGLYISHIVLRSFSVRPPFVLRSFSVHSPFALRFPIEERTENDRRMNEKQREM